MDAEHLHLPLSGLLEHENLLSQMPQIYKSCFAERPWNEFYSEQEARAAILRDMNSREVLIATLDGQVLAFLIGQPLISHADAETLAAAGLRSDCFYITEALTHPGQRRKGYCKGLFIRIEALVRDSFTYIGFRTHVENLPMLKLGRELEYSMHGQCEAETAGKVSVRQVLSKDLRS